MAEGILFGVAQKIIENLASQIFQEIGSLWGVKDELENIKNTVSRIQAVLQDAMEKQNHNHQVRDWLEKLNDAVYDADDLLSEFSTEASRRKAMSGNKIAKKVRTFFSSSNPLVFRCEMSGKIKAMRKKLDAIAKDNRDFNLKVSLVEKHGVSMEREETHSFVPNETVIGREDDKRAIIKLLLEENAEENVSVITIVGIGGLGKTTLAQYVYNDEKVRTYFELKMWVCVSNIFDVKTIVQKIISAMGEKLKDNMDQLQDQLRSKLDQKKYLLVLDDVWNEEPTKWDSLKILLMGGAKGSKIVITTRIKLVAEITSSVSIYTLNGLSGDQSWSLFKQIAFRKDQAINNLRLVEIGREIVGKCQGVPLAIKSIGSVLRFEETEHKWSYVKNNLLESVTQQENGIFPILKFSYDHLPSYLKGCFGFCSLFPKNYEIDKVTLTQLWIAQGFIQSSNRNQQLKDVADEYFKDLLWRSFFEEVTNSPGVYKMHDLIHDLAELVAGVECKLIDFDGKNINEKNRHVSCPFSIGSSFTETLKSLLKAYKIRTFLLTSSEYSTGALDESMLNTLVLSFKSLRALDLHGLGITRMPDSIGKLIHLKYLDLSNNGHMITLPHSITRLWNLQTLKLQGCWQLKELPRDIRELVNLKDLDNSGCNGLSHMPNGLGHMTSLQTLPLFIVSKDPPSIARHIGGLGVLNQLNNLRGRLEITHLERVEDANSESKAMNLKEKQHLEKLILRWDEIDNNVGDDDEKSLEGLQPHQNLQYLVIERYGGVRFSSWLSSLTNLVDLNLMDCKRCRHLPPLSQLSSLECLDLSFLEDLEYISEKDITEEVHASSTPFFPSLKSLSMYSCPNLKGWWGKRDLIATTSTSMPDHQQHQHHQSLPSFPRLSSLRIHDCPNLTSMPLFPYLEEQLHLWGVSLKLLQETMAMASSLPSSFPLSKLTYIYLESIEDEVSLPNEWGSNLTSLKRLEILWCSKTTSLHGVMRYLTSLEELRITGCYEFDPLSDMDDHDGMEWQHLNCLRSLKFEDLPKLMSLPAGLQHVTTLKELLISNCRNLISLPEWFSELTSLEQLKITRSAPNLTSLPDGISCIRSLRWLTISGFPNLMTFPESISNLTALQQLDIISCPNLKSLPDGMRHLKSLQKLRIAHCPHLEKKCQERIGEDWPKIAHIPNFSNLVERWE